MAGTLTTPVDLISLCLRTAGVLGVGQTADASDTQDCFVLLNAMIGQWNRERWLIPHLIDTSIISTGAISYTVGDTGDFDVPRTDRLQTAYARLLNSSPSNPFDFPLRLIDSRETYSDITLKSLSTFPTSVFLDSGYPLGDVYFWPIPAADKFELHLVIKAHLESFPTITTAFDLAPEYIDALIWNLSCRIRPLYQLPPDPTQVALAKASLGVIRQANAQVAELRMPSAVLNSRGGYDVTLGNLNGLPWSV